MINARDELIEMLNSIGKTQEDIKICKFAKRISYYEYEAKELNELNFDYDDGYGGQNLHGLVVFNDGSWLERGEYDGSEWWEYKHTPTSEDVFSIGTKPF